MPNGSEPGLGLYGGTADFSNTDWFVVATARQGATPESARALEVLCRTYWSPLCAYVRRRGFSEPEAQDLTQEFFARLLEKNYLHWVDREKGKFRSFLLGALKNFLATEWRRASALKRGGGASFLPLDAPANGQSSLEIAADDLSPEDFFDQQWAITVMEQVFGKLQREFEAAGKGALFAALKNYVTGEKPDTSYADLAPSLNTTEAALRMAVSRMRSRFADLLRAEIASTLLDPREVEDEMRALFAALSR